MNIKRIVIFLLILLLIPINANAKTVGQLKKEYADLEAKNNSTNNSIKYTDSQISAAKSRVQSIYGELEQAEKDIQKTNDEIAKLNESIIEKDKELKDLMRFFQASEGESTYLEYIFKANSITDFIYRASVTEQLSKYNDELIDQMNKMIAQNKKNIEDLHKKEDSLKALRQELNEKLVILASKKEALSEESATIEEEIKATKSILDFYVKSGCSDNQDISSCAAAQLPPGTKFWRPINYGWVTDEYGLRTCPVHGPGELHSGIDMSSNDRRIYSISDGKVKYTGYSSSMGNYIVIHHNINGKEYSSVYMHLASIYVNKNDIVNKDTNIGYMGTTGSSTGIHLHLTMYVGLYLEPGRKATMVNPRDYINFPRTVQKGNIYPNFYDRTSYYN